MTPTLAALVLTNLLYLVGAVVVASLVSGLYVLRHRKPKSVESGIESFSRELRALAPERRADTDRSATAPTSEKAQKVEPTARRNAEVTAAPPPTGDVDGADPGSRSG